MPDPHLKVQKPLRRLIELNLSPVEVARGLRRLPGLIFLDSSSTGSGESRSDASLSIVTACPAGMVRGEIQDPAGRKDLRLALERFHSGKPEPDYGFPLGGAIGTVEYDGRFSFGIYPEMLIHDHRSGDWHEIGNLSNQIDRCEAEDPLEKSVPRVDFEPPLSREDFGAMVDRAREYIAAGDIYQANLSHRFHAPWPTEVADAFPLYERLRSTSPAPFSAFLDVDGRQVLSTSPELFLHLSGSSVRTRPIKGTRPRFRDPARDEKSAYDLITSPKEIAELIMITDLERNDLGQICEFGSVQAIDLLKLERYEQVFHLVSTVEGLLRPEVDHIDALAACFPGGSITGAPKKRAREIIAELEPDPRGLYTGAIGILGFNGESRFNIAIRTALVENGELHFHAGAGIVADSDPDREYEETLHKAAGILQACGLESRLSAQ